MGGGGEWEYLAIWQRLLILINGWIFRLSVGEFDLTYIFVEQKLSPGQNHNALMGLGAIQRISRLDIGAQAHLSLTTGQVSPGLGITELKFKIDHSL